MVEGTIYDVAGINEIAKVPSRDELISKFLGSIQSPITNFARVLKQIAEKGDEVEVKVEAPVEEAKAEAPVEEAKAEAPVKEAKTEV